MLNLLRMDLYRIFHSKSLYICFGVLAFVNILTFGILFVITNPSARDFIVRFGAEVTSDAADIEAALAGTSILEVFHQGTVGGGFLSVTIGIFAALLVCMDFDSGFIKNIMAVHENKWDYILSKGACLCIVNILYLVGTLLVTLLLNFCSGGFFEFPTSADTAFYLFTAWLLINGFSAITLLVCILTRSKAAGVAGALCINSGLIVTILNTVFHLFGLQWITEYSLYMTLASLPSSFKGEYGLKPLLTGCLFFILYVVISKVILAKKDI